MSEKGYFMNLWCRVCRYHLCRCTPASPTVPYKTEQYSRTMTMDDMRRNALESMIEDLKERD